MRRRLSAASLALALLVTPTTAAFAEEPSLTEQPTEDDATSGPLIALAELLAQWAQGLIDGRAATSGDAVDEDAAGTYGELVESLEAVLTDLFANVYFSGVAEDALADAEEELQASSDDAHGEAVSTVARCAPRGSFGGLVEGMAHHGTYIRAAAHAEMVALTVPTIEVDEATGAPSVVTEPGERGEPVEFDLNTVEGAEALCDALDVVYQARLLQLDVAWEDVDSARDARVLAREQCRLERLRARNDDGTGDARDACAEFRERVRDQHREERSARRAEHEADRDAKAAERAERKADRAASKADRIANKADRAASKADRAGKH